MTLGEPIDLSVGALMLVKTGADVSAGDALLEIRSSCQDKLKASLPFFEKAFFVEKTTLDSPRKGEEMKRSFVLGTIR